MRARLCCNERAINVFKMQVNRQYCNRSMVDELLHSLEMFMVLYIGRKNWTYHGYTVHLGRGNTLDSLIHGGWKIIFGSHWSKFFTRDLQAYYSSTQKALSRLSHYNTTLVLFEFLRLLYELRK